MTPNYSLPGHLDSASAPPLASDLLDLRGAPLCIDASEVSFAGTLSLQVLIAARKQWDEDDQGFEVTCPSPALCRAAKGLGVPMQAFGANDADLTMQEMSA